MATKRDRLKQRWHAAQVLYGEDSKRARRARARYEQAISRAYAGVRARLATQMDSLLVDIDLHACAAPLTWADVDAIYGAQLRALGLSIVHVNNEHICEHNDARLTDAQRAAYAAWDKRQTARLAAACRATSQGIDYDED